MTTIKTEKGWQIKSHTTGKIYPKVYPSKEAADKRIQQMEYFKHKELAVDKHKLYDDDSDFDLGSLSNSSNGFHKKKHIAIKGSNPLNTLRMEQLRLVGKLAKIEGAINDAMGKAQSEEDVVKISELLNKRKYTKKAIIDLEREVSHFGVSSAMDEYEGEMFADVEEGIKDKIFHRFEKVNLVETTIISVGAILLTASLYSHYKAKKE